jgi:hypothetical protein
MLSKQQKMLLHIYKDAAGISDPVYRDILRASSGCASAADRNFPQGGFEHAMARLETILFSRVSGGEIANPLGRNRYILAEHHWRGRIPRRNFINSRQARLIEQLWFMLQDHLPVEQRHLPYLGGIIHQATGKRDIGYTALTSQEAGFVIDALKDRLSHALAQKEEFHHVPAAV